VGPLREEGSRHLRRQAAGSRDHSGCGRGHLLWPRIVRGWGKGAQGGLHISEHPIDAPRGVGSRRRRHQR
jgi:hypothetical protein